MKICTACNASYSDETLSFCPVDGTTLTPQKAISFDQVPFSYEPESWADAESQATNQTDIFTNPEPPPIPTSFSAPPSAPQNTLSATGRNTKNSSIFPVVVGSIAIVTVAGVLIAIMSGGSRSSKPEVIRSYGNTATAVNGASVRAEPVGTPMSTAGGNGVYVANTRTSANTAPASNTAVSTNEPVKPIPRTTGFTGIWQGKFNEEPTVLSITTQNGDTFSGTLSKKGYIVKIAGKVDFEKGAVTITETKVLQTPPNLTWNLGTNDGTIFDGGKVMSGIGRDKNGSYSWSFTKD